MTNLVLIIEERENPLILISEEIEPEMITETIRRIEEAEIDHYDIPETQNCTVVVKVKAKLLQRRKAVSVQYRI